MASSKLIHNFRRSTSTWETTTLNIGFETPLDVVEQLKTRLKGYISDNNREWSDVVVNIDKIENQNAIYLNISVQHKANWQDWGGRWSRRTAFMRHLKTVLEELEIAYSKPLQPVILHPSSVRSSRGPLSPSTLSPSGHGLNPMSSVRRRRSTAERHQDDLGNAGGYGPGKDRGVMPGLSIDSEVGRFSR